MKSFIVIINILIIMSSCNLNYQLSEEDKGQIINILKNFNGIFQPEEEVIIFGSLTNDWRLFDGSGTIVSRTERIEKIKTKLALMKKEKYCTDRYINSLFVLFKKNDEVNLGMLLTNNKFGNYMVRVLPNRVNILNDYCLEVEWEGDEEYLKMNDIDFFSFLKTRIQGTLSRKAIFWVPYAEASITPCDQAERKYYSYVYYFTLEKNGVWLLDDIRIEESKD